MRAKAWQTFCRFGVWGGLMLVLGATGCGYTPVGVASGAAAQRISLAVTPFTNQTREPGVETQVTVALRQAVLRHPAFSLAVAEATGRRVQGIVRRFRAYPVSYDRNDNALQYRLEADILIRLLDGTAPTPTLEREVTTWAEYLIFRSSEVREGAIREHVIAREAAVLQLAQRFAQTCTALLIVTLLPAG